MTDIAYPAVVSFETVMGCNAACVMCPITSTVRKKERMKVALFERLVLEIAAWPKLPAIALHGLGEPLMDKGLENRIAFLRKYRMPYIEFSTNGSLLNQERAITLAECGPDVLTISLEAFEKKLYESIRIGLDFDIVTMNIKNFIKERNKVRASKGCPTRIELLFITHEDNRHQLKDYIEYWYPLLSEGDRIRLYERHSFGGSVSSNVMPSNKPCGLIYSVLNIQADGTVPMCCSDSDGKYRMGDTKIKSLAEIWNDSAYTELRRLHSSGLRKSIQICGDCTTPEVSNMHIPGGRTLTWTHDTMGTNLSWR